MAGLLTPRGWPGGWDSFWIRGTARFGRKFASADLAGHALTSELNLQYGGKACQAVFYKLTMFNVPKQAHKFPEPFGQLNLAFGSIPFFWVS
jgi:hypothetical protein